MTQVQAHLSTILNSYYKGYNIIHLNHFCEKFQEMRIVIILVLLVAIAAASTSFGDREFHLHPNLKNTTSNLVVRSLISRYIDKLAHQTNQHDINLHLYADGMTDEELEAFSLGDIFGGNKKEVDNPDNRRRPAGFHIEYDGIDYAIWCVDQAFKKVKKFLENIDLSRINISPLTQPKINVNKLSSKLRSCGEALKKIESAYFKFAKAVEARKTADAVKSIISTLKHMPKITEKCLNKPFTIPPIRYWDEICDLYISSLATTVKKFSEAPEQYIENPFNLSSLITNIPNIIAGCTGAFA